MLPIWVVPVLSPHMIPILLVPVHTKCYCRVPCDSPCCISEKEASPWATGLHCPGQNLVFSVAFVLEKGMKLIALVGSFRGVIQISLWQGRLWLHLFLCTCVAAGREAFRCCFCSTSSPLQITAQQQELLFLDQQLNQRKEELHILQDCISQKKGDLKEALQDGETEANEKLRQIRVMFPNEFSNSFRLFSEEQHKNRIMGGRGKCPIKSPQNQFCFLQSAKAHWKNRSSKLMVVGDLELGPDAQISRTP